MPRARLASSSNFNRREETWQIQSNQQKARDVAASLGERALTHAPDALTTDRPHQLAAELAERRLLAA